MGWLKIVFRSCRKTLRLTKDSVKLDSRNSEFRLEVERGSRGGIAIAILLMLLRYGDHAASVFERIKSVFAFREVEVSLETPHTPSWNERVEAFSPWQRTDQLGAATSDVASNGTLGDVKFVMPGTSQAVVVVR